MTWILGNWIQFLLGFNFSLFCAFILKVGVNVQLLFYINISVCMTTAFSCHNWNFIGCVKNQHADFSICTQFFCVYGQSEKLHIVFIFKHLLQRLSNFKFLGQIFLQRISNVTILLNKFTNSQFYLLHTIYSHLPFVSSNLCFLLCIETHHPPRRVLTFWKDWISWIISDL